MDDATDELFAHMQRCQVPGATEKDVADWMNDTRQFLSDRYPDLTAEQLASLETIGRRYAQPAIPHGKDATARNRDDWEGQAEVTETESESAEAPADADEASEAEDLSPAGENESGELMTA